MTTKLTIELPEDLANYAQAKVVSGEYGSLDEAVAAGVRELKDHDDLIDRWVRDAVIPSYERWVEDGKPVLTEEDVWQSVEAAIAETAGSKAS